MEAVTIFLRAHTASEQLKSPDTCVAPVASVKNGLTHQKICTSSKKNTALLNQQPPNPAVAKVSQVYYYPLLGWAAYLWRERCVSGRGVVEFGRSLKPFSSSSNP